MRQKAYATNLARRIKSMAGRNLPGLGGLAIVLVWCMPYVFTGNRLEWGDFSFFAQAYEAIRISILEYGQFPWWNPWVSGGVPLYANPQIGVFSLQTIFVLLFGAPVGLKIALTIYTILGYASMYALLRKYFKVDGLTSTLLSLLWIFCTFFVAHLPAHVTFAWYMLAPAFVHVSLSMRSLRGGILLGAMFAIMALAQTHNPFVHISIVCAVILIGRLFLAVRASKKNAVEIAIGLGAAAATFLVFAGHRLLFTYQNIHDFPRDIVDLASPLAVSAYGFLLPYSPVRGIPLFNYPGPPLAQHGFGEVAASIGIGAIVALAMCIFYLAFYFRQYRHGVWHFRQPFVLLVGGLTCLAIGFGAVSDFAPYSLLKHLPVLSDMRVSHRWFIFANMFFLIFIGVMFQHLKKKGTERPLIRLLLVVGILQLFVFGFNYQSKIFTHLPSSQTYDKSSAFIQQSYFGSISKNQDGDTINGSTKPQPYREYDSMFYNVGVLYANDAFVQIHLANRESPLCGVDKQCNFVKSDNARVVSWSPNRLVLERTGSGDIELNMSESSYMTINGKRNTAIKVAEPFESFRISDSSKRISIDIRPSAFDSIKGTLKKKPQSDYN